METVRLQRHGCPVHRMIFCDGKEIVMGYRRPLLEAKARRRSRKKDRDGHQFDPEFQEWIPLKSTHARVERLRNWLDTFDPELDRIN